MYVNRSTLTDLRKEPTLCSYKKFLIMHNRNSSLGANILQSTRMFSSPTSVRAWQVFSILDRNLANRLFRAYTLDLLVLLFVLSGSFSRM